MIRNLRLAVANGKGSAALLPLSNLVSYSAYATPSEINRQELTRQVTISANLDNPPLGTAVGKVQEASKKLALAPGYRVVFSEDAEGMAESFGYMAEALVPAVLIVYFTVYPRPSRQALIAR